MSELTPEQAEAYRLKRSKEVDVIHRPDVPQPIKAKLPAVIETAIGSLRASLDNPTPEVASGDWQKELAQKKHAAAVAAIKEQWQVPKRHLMLPILDTNSERGRAWLKVFSALERRLKSGFLLALVGTRGNGKTQLGVELMKRLAEQELPVFYCSAMGFFIEVKSSYGRNSKTTEEFVIEDYRKPALLVIDEAGRRGETDWEDRMLFELLDKRYGDMTDTVLISNQTQAEFVSGIGPSLSSRMIETGGIIECNWKSFRS